MTGAPIDEEPSTMNLNADFTKSAVVHAATLDWKASPMPGVERRMLDRIGDEIARAPQIGELPIEGPIARTKPGGLNVLVLRGL